MARSSSDKGPSLAFEAFTPEQFEQIADKLGLVTGKTETACDDSGRRIVHKFEVLGELGDGSFIVHGKGTDSVWVPVAAAQVACQKAGVSADQFIKAAIAEVTGKASGASRTVQTDSRLAASGQKGPAATA